MSNFPSRLASARISKTPLSTPTFARASCRGWEQERTSQWSASCSSIGGCTAGTYRLSDPVDAVPLAFHRQAQLGGRITKTTTDFVILTQLTQEFRVGQDMLKIIC